jgi:hypothetical protein
VSTDCVKFGQVEKRREPQLKVIPEMKSGIQGLNLRFLPVFELQHPEVVMDAPRGKYKSFHGEI